MKSKKAFIYKGSNSLTAILFLALIFLFAGNTPAVVNLEVPIEMVDRGISSLTSTQNYKRSAVYLNEADYDGDTEDYYFEIVAENENTDYDYAVYLRDVTNTQDKTSILIPAKTTAPTRFRTTTPFTPDTGNNEYRIKLDGTQNAEDLRIYTARIIVVQKNATKTRIQIPLLNHGYNGYINTTNAGTDNTSSTTYTQSIPGRFSLWQKDASAWGDIAVPPATPWTFEAVARTTSDIETAYVSLFNYTDNTQVTATEVGATGATGFQLMTVDFASDATNFDDSDEFEVRHHTTDTTGTYESRIARVSLYVRLTNLSKGEIYWRFARKVSATANNTNGCQRVLLNINNYTSPEIYHESTGWESTLGDITVKVFDAGTSDSSKTGSAVSNSDINFDSDTKARQRTTTDLIPYLTSRNRYIRDIAVTDGTIEVASCWLVVKFADSNIINENFEATGAYGYDEAGWTEVVDASCTLDENAAPIPGTPPTGSGSECLKAIVLDTTSNDAYAYITKPDQNISYVQGYLYVSQEGLNDGQLFLTLGLFNGASERAAGIEIGQSGGVPVLRFTYFSNGILNYTGLLTIALNTWYQVEYKYDITNLAWEVKIDGISKASGPLVAPTRTPQKMLIGILGYQGTAGPSTLYTDLVVWDNGSGKDTSLTVCQSGGCDYTTIEAAVTNAIPGDTVTVTDSATYNPNPLQMKTSVDVVSTWNYEVDPPEDRPLIIRTSGNETVLFNSGVSNCKLKGFGVQGLDNMAMEGTINLKDNNTGITIEDCDIYGEGVGQGIMMWGQASVTIKGCTIHDIGCVGISGYRAGAYWTGGTIVIEDTEVYNCGSSGFTTGGIYFIDANTGDAYPGQVTITSNCYVHDCYKGGIRLYNLSQVTIENSTIENNGTGGTAGAEGSAYGGIRIQNVDTVTISNNVIRNHANAAGICIEGNSDVTIGADLVPSDPFPYGNEIYGNYAGIYFRSANSQPVIIRGNNIYGNNGRGGIRINIALTGEVTITQNSIHDNTWGGISINNTCTGTITKNDIYSNTNRGGIHTAGGSPTLTIRQNKVHDNQGANRGGGIDVRHASGVIENNLVYKNGRGGIRIGDDINDVINNTVVWNGFNNTLGGGIVYDDPATGAINDPPDKTYNDPTLPFIRNNICAYNRKAGIGVVFDNSGGERDYNLLYDNWYGETVLGYNYGDCSWTGWPGCKKRQLGGAWPVAPNEIFGDPLFETGTDNYHLQSGSPAEGAGDDLTDMGCYGGDFPIDDAEIP